MKKLGVLGGTFDPVHSAHLTIAGAAAEELGLEKVFFVPAAVPYHKREAWGGGKADYVAAAEEHRLAMLALALEGEPRFEVSRVDLDREGPTYSVDTIAALRREVGEDAELYFIVGMDSVAEMPNWREPERLLSLCRVVAVPRPGWETLAATGIEKRLPGTVERVMVLSAPLLDVSSSNIRHHVAAAARSLDGLVPEAVELYIREHGLYAAE